MPAQHPPPKSAPGLEGGLLISPFGSSLITPLPQCFALATQQYFPTALLPALFHPGLHSPRWVFDRCLQAALGVLQTIRKLGCEPA